MTRALPLPELTLSGEDGAETEPLPRFLDHNANPEARGVA